MLTHGIRLKTRVQPMLIRGIRGLERGVKPGVGLGVRLGVGVRMCTPLTLARSMYQYRFQDAIRMIRPAMGMGTMVTMVTMVTIRLLPQGVIQVIHIVMVTLRPVTHQLNLQLQHATQTIHIATLRCSP